MSIWPARTTVISACADREDLIVEVVRGGVELIEPLQAEWRDLCSGGPSHEPFFRPEWIAGYLRAFDPGARLVLLSVRRKGRLRAVLPLVEERGFLNGMPVRRLRAAANIHNLHFELVCCAGQEAQEVVSALWRFIEQMPGWDVIDLPYILRDGSLAELTSAALNAGMFVGRRESWRSLHVNLRTETSDGEPWLHTTSHQFRKKVTRRRRQLEALAPLVLQCTSHYDPSALQRFYQLERSGWKGAVGTAIACDSATAQFYDLIARNAGHFGYLSLYFLESGGRPVAAHLGFTYQGRYFLAKAAYDEKYSRYGPGHLLVLEVLRDCWQRGVAEFDFVGPRMEDEAHWAKESRVVEHARIFRSGFYGRLLHLIEFPIKNAVKTLLGSLVAGKAPTRPSSQPA